MNDFKSAAAKAAAIGLLYQEALNKIALISFDPITLKLIKTAFEAADKICEEPKEKPKLYLVKS